MVAFLDDFVFPFPDAIDQSIDCMTPEWKLEGSSPLPSLLYFHYHQLPPQFLVASPSSKTAGGGGWDSLSLSFSHSRFISLFGAKFEFSTPK
jgi:hypothetical protein